MNAHYIIGSPHYLKVAMTILDAQPRGPPSGLSAQVQPPPTNLELRLQLLQGEGTGLPSPGPGCARCGEEPAALPSATPAGACRGLSWPLPGRGFPLPHRAVVQPAGFSLPLPRHGRTQSCHCHVPAPKTSSGGPVCLCPQACSPKGPGDPG